MGHHLVLVFLAFASRVGKCPFCLYLPVFSGFYSLIVMLPQVCIIGAGSSGIVALKTLRQHGIEAVCFEKGSGIGGNWRYQNDNGMSSAYRSLHINTSRDLMAYSDFPMPADYPDYPHHSQILAYFESYVEHFGLQPHIRFERGVAEVKPRPGGGYQVTTEQGESHFFSQVLVANGHH